MPKIELGEVGAVLSPAAEGFVDAAVELERLGYSTLWLTGGQLAGLSQIADVVQATSSIRVASGIISVDRFEPAAVATIYSELEASHPGRFIVGLGGAHGPNPFRTLNAYLDALGTVPVSARLLAALGPRMFELARERAAAAFPVLITPEYTARARALIGDDTTLAVDQLVVLEPDLERARAIARGPLGFFRTVPAYQASFRRMGFTDDEIGQLDDRLVDALVPAGDVHALHERILAQLRAGADHVAISLTTLDPTPTPLDQYEQLAKELILN